MLGNSASGPQIGLPDRIWAGRLRESIKNGLPAGPSQPEAEIEVEVASTSSTGTQNRIRILWARVGSKGLQVARLHVGLQAARLHPQRKYIHHHLVGVVGRAASRETPGEV